MTVSANKTDPQTGVCIKVFIWSADLCHELVGDGLQELGLVVLGADEVGWTRGSGLCRRKINK